ncbi:lon protease homolog 2, peroxisomal-like [Saccoglossus kowalevskii]|uniref:Lon protease homolog 2, peroxisomal n=1 Tax=Saccoglossus kowalevskii TaxID=10224 RepID=A0ABM0GQI7_SACKO|nr:PREDICTED: lon protease homolog 2, peroxisomal-like [Saccoglossus kowalevskii]
MASSALIRIPRRLPLLLLADGVLLPGSSMRIPVHSAKNMHMVKNHLLKSSSLSNTIIGVITKERDSQDEDASGLHSIGTAAVVVQVTGTNWPRPAYTLLLTGLCRFKLDKLLQQSPYPIAAVSQLDRFPGDNEPVGDFSDDELAALTDNFLEHANKLVDMLDISIPIVAKLKRMLDSVPAQNLPDIFASIIKTSFNEKLQILDAVDLAERFKKTLPLLVRQIEGLKLLKQSRKNNDDEFLAFKKTSRKPYIIRSSKNFHLDPEDDDGDGDEMVDLEQRLKAANLPEHAKKAAQKELKRLKKMPSSMPDYSLTRNYLELMSELPWSKETTDNLSIAQARLDLDADHYGLDKLKKRVIEYLAVRQIKNSLKGPILCFVGPPGVGKTSVGKSVAKTLGREFHRISLGGVCDQSDIRGHRRTYIGSMPGRIIQGLKTVGVSNPVFLLDEIDKLNKSLQGDPAAALLEVLDPEQNSTFVDHYLNVQFDLSKVLFIATANSMSTIPAALLDRMEVIHVAGYTQEEKVHIGVRHLIPKQLKEHGLNAEQLQFPEDTIKMIIARYTREAGVRSLERKLAAVCRAVAVKVAENMTIKTKNGKQDLEKENVEPEKEPLSIDEKESLSSAATLAHPPDMPIVIDEHALQDILGPPMFENETSERLGQPGVAIGLAWTEVGGQIMFVEATKMDGDGNLTLTGQLGDVMKESARIALNWVRSNATRCAIKVSTGTDLMENTDIHIHFPAGSISKDGPSAGVTVVSVLVSLFSGRCVRSDTAMTGEVTLRGLVLPVGGIKDKVLAAHRTGLKRVVLPKRNEKDLQEIPTNVKNDLDFVFVTKLEDVLQAVFEGGYPELNANVPSTQSKL